MGIRTSGCEIIGAALANSLKADEDRKSDRTTLVQVKEEEGVTHTATTKMNLRQGRQACVAPAEILAQRRPGYGFRLAMSNVGWLVTQKFVILVPDTIGFAPWSVLIGRGEPCDSC